jgi:hypothetical protein
MNQALIKDVSYVFVLKGIVDHLSLTAVLHEPGLAKGSELMGNGGLVHAQKSRNIADAHFGPQQGTDDFDPGGIAEYLKQIRQIQQQLIIGHIFPDRSYHIFVDYIAVKAFNVLYHIVL